MKGVRCKSLKGKHNPSLNDQEPEAINEVIVTDKTKVKHSLITLRNLIKSL